VCVVLKSDALPSDFCNICFKISLIFLCLVDLTQPFYAEDVLIILLMDSNFGSEIFLLVIFGVDYVTWTNYVTSHIYLF
jgi:hypothetical protein